MSEDEIIDNIFIPSNNRHPCWPLPDKDDEKKREEYSNILSIDIPLGVEPNFELNTNYYGKLTISGCACGTVFVRKQENNIEVNLIKIYELDRELYDKIYEAATLIWSEEAESLTRN